ncbi:predicted protein [Plenodomus lingam JN3]|uniref:Predicted protein n=1 Tax=Leptosphaeria maculans (strain JN3 / isolate v23.1.3 / race Av1-4-5-6-7-8) TaxID=985895 RepID=E5A5Q2_LEPMJ|nr:predicted protein [Plenodomus lingam JN3]CBX98950.1 predicted protein [Plenodomus lingam JN3]
MHGNRYATGAVMLWPLKWSLEKICLHLTATSAIR